MLLRHVSPQINLGATLCGEFLIQDTRVSAPVSATLYDFLPRLEAPTADHLLDRHARSQADGSVLLLTRDLAGLDPALVAEVFVALWRRESWPQRDMTGAHYQSLVGMLRAVDDGGRGTSPCDLPGGIHVAAGPRHTLEFRRRHSAISTRR